MEKGLGWVPVPRCIQDEVFYTDSNYIHLFIHIILNMNKKDKMHQGIIIKKNQLKTGRLSLSESTGIQESKVSRILNKLQELGYIEQQTTNKYRIITVLYAPCTDIFEQHMTSGEQQATTGEQQATTGEQQVTSGDTTNITTGKKEKGNKLSITDFEIIFKTYKPNFRKLPNLDSLEYKRCNKVTQEIGSVAEVIKIINEYFQYLAIEDWRKPKGFKEFMNSAEHYGNDWLSEIKGYKSSEPKKLTLRQKLEAEGK